jgi:hypothetical protein
MPDKAGTDQWMLGKTVQPIRNIGMTYSGPPMHASGRRRYSSICAHVAFLALARDRKLSYQRNIIQATTAPTPSGLSRQYSHLRLQSLRNLHGRKQSPA